VPTLKEDPAEAEAISHKGLMLRAGLVSQLAAGIYVYLPLGQRVLERSPRSREEMNAIGGQEMTMPVLHPAEIWRDRGWEAIGGEMFRLKIQRTGHVSRHDP